MKSFFAHFKNDLFGGLTAGVVALPLALAFGVSSGLGASAGLYGAVFIGFFAAWFGGTPTQISGPTAPMTAVSMLVVGSVLAMNQGNLEKALPTILFIFLLAGLMQVGFGLIGLGRYIRYIPYPVVSGFMTAIGVIILITQLLPALGYYPKEDLELVEQYRLRAEAGMLSKIVEEEAGEGILVLEDLPEMVKRSEQYDEKAILTEARSMAVQNSSGVIGTIRVLGRAVEKINLLELALCVITVLIVYGFKRITTKIPSTLLALLGVSAVAYGLGLDYRPIQQIPEGFPVLRYDIFTNFQSAQVFGLIFSAFTLALLGSIDSLLTSVVADNMTKTRHLPNKELIGQGIGNSIASLFGGIPGAGATIRTVVNINSGGKSRLSGMVAAVMLLVVLLALGPIASKIPAAVLAGILITVGLSVIDYKGLKAIPSLPKDVKLGPIRFSSEVIVLFVVLLLSALWNLVYAVGIGLIIASLMFMKKIGDLMALNSDVKSLEEEKSWPDEAAFPEHLKKLVFIKHLKGPLFFGTAKDLLDLAKQIPESAQTVIIRLGRMPYMDQSGLYAMEEILTALHNKGVCILLVNIQEQPRYLLERIDIIPDLVSENHIFGSFETCVNWLVTHYTCKDNV
jgi:SulP family sulfate permease